MKQKSFENTYENRMAQFQRDEERKTAPTNSVDVKTPISPSSTTAQQYQQSWQVCLGLQPEWRKRKILELMEQKNFDHRILTEFVQMVIGKAEN
jgi:hypothetical protein